MKSSVIRYSMLTDRAGVQPIGCRLGSTGPNLRLTAIRSPGLPFNGRHPRISWNYTHLPILEDGCTFLIVSVVLLFYRSISSKL